jgi:hypothetical protein
MASNEPRTTARLAELGDVAGFSLLRNHRNLITGVWCPRQAQYFYGGRGARRFNLFAALVVHRANAADKLAGDDNVTLIERSVLHENGRHRTTASIKP